MNKTLWFSALLAGLALASALSQPSKALRSGDRNQPLLAGAQANPQVVGIFERSCQNCHSANTEWPLYGRVFPFTVLIANDIRAARSHMDLSSWPLYGDQQKRIILSEIGVMVRNGEMPPQRYTLLHPEAKLTPEEASEVYQWTRSARGLLKPNASTRNIRASRE